MKGASPKEPVTVYKGIKASVIGQDLVPTVERDQIINAELGIIRQGVPSQDKIADLLRRGYSMEEIAAMHVNDSHISPGLSWTFDINVAQKYATNYSTAGTPAVVIQAQVFPSEMVVVQNIRGGALRWIQSYVAEAVGREQEVVTFGRFPFSRYTVVGQ